MLPKIAKANIAKIVPQLRGTRNPKPRLDSTPMLDLDTGIHKRAAHPRPPAAKRALSELEVRLAYAVGISLFVAAACLTPVTQTSWREIPGFIVCYSVTLIMVNLLVAVLLITKSRNEHDHSHMVLAAAYLFAGFIIVPHLASFPNALVPGYLLGQPGSATWLWVFWHGGFACLVILYALAARVTMEVPRLRLVFPGVLLLVTCLAFVALRDVPYLPVILTGNRYFDGHTGFFIMAGVFLSTVTALALVAARLRTRQAENLWLTVGLIGATADIWLSLAGGQRFSLGWYCGRLCGLSTSAVLMLSLLYDVLKTYGTVSAANDTLDQLSLTDALTRLGNRRMFDITLENEWRRCRRDKLPLSVVMFDVDQFKFYNDTYGHQAGDVCLQKIAERLYEAAARAGDVAARYGGEEFALILPATDKAGSEYLARLVRLTVRNMGLPHIRSEKQVITISAGVATLVPSEQQEAAELVRLADLALYQAKDSGRDTVMSAD